MHAQQEPERCVPNLQLSRLRRVVLGDSAKPVESGSWDDKSKECPEREALRLRG